MRGFPPPIIFERLKLPQQIIYHRKGNVSESPNQFRYRKKYFEFAILYAIFAKWSKFRPFWKFEKNFKLLEHKHVIHHFESRDLEIPKT